MATGTFTKQISTNNSCGMKVVWESTPNTSKNTSDVKVTLYMYHTGTIGFGSRTGTITINGKKYSFTHMAISVSSSNPGDTYIAEATCTSIAHNDDGSKSVSISVSWNFNTTFSNGVRYETQTVSGTAILDTIPRKSTLTASNGTLGTSQTLTVTKKVSTFTHTIKYKCGTASGTVCTKSSDTEISFKPPESLASQNTTGTSVSVQLTITTYNTDDSSIGSNSTTITCSIPSSLKPSCAIGISDSTGYNNTYGGYVQGKSKFSIEVTPVISYGSEISAYSVVANGVTYTTHSVATDVIKTSGNNVITATVRDQRGRTGSASSTVSVLAYSTPVISSISVHRCDADGSENQQGDYMEITWSSSVTSLNSNNSATYEIKYKQSSSTSYTSYSGKDLAALQGSYSISDTSIVIPADSSLSYDIELVVSDDFSSTTKKTSVSTAFTIIHFGSDGTSIAFGKLAETSNLLDTGLNARFNADVYGTAVGLAGMPTIPKNADANTYLTPGCYGLKSNSTANTVSNFPLTGVAGRLFVATALGASIKTDGWIYLRQTFVPYQTIYPTYERYIYQKDSTSWTYWDWTPTTMQALPDLLPSELATALPTAMLSSIEQKSLWAGGWLMGENHTVTLSEAVSKQYNGIILVWSAYTDGTIENANFNLFYVPKFLVTAHPGCGICCHMGRVNFSTMSAKYVYINDTTITGSAYNVTTSTTGSSGITYNNFAYVLRRVIGV